MRKLFIICALLFCLGTASAQQKFSVASPDGKLKLVLDIAPEKVAYSVKYGKQQLLEDSRLGFEFDSGEFGAGLKAGKVQRRKIDEAYELVVGKVRRARNYCNEMTVPLVERNGKERTVNLIVRAFDDGIAFRYEFPEQHIYITDYQRLFILIGTTSVLTNTKNVWTNANHCISWFCIYVLYRLFSALLWNVRYQIQCIG